MSDRPTAPARRIAAAGGLLVASLALIRAVRPPSFRITDPEGPPTLDAAGRARSVQAAELTLRPATLDAIWSPSGLDRLGRTYWRFLPRITLGLIRVIPTPDAELVVLLARPAVLLAFGRPDHLLDCDRAVVTWPIRGGLLVVARPEDHPGAAGVLTLELRRLGPTPATRPPGRPAVRPAARPAVRVEVSVIDFHPVIARRFGARAYALTQARVHVFVTHSFLRSLARTRLAALHPPAESPPAADSPTHPLT